MNSNWLIISPFLCDLQGFEKNFFWNIEQSGAQRPYRILQKRGVFVDAEDYLPVTATYPEHPLKKVQPNAKNIEELKNKRKEAYKADVEKYSKLHEDFRAASNPPPKNYMTSEFFGNNKYTSINQKIAEQRRNARKAADLTDIVHDSKDERVAPSLAYVSQPKIKSKSILD